MSNQILEAGKQLFTLKAQRDKLEDELKVVNKQITELETITLSKLMDDAEVEKINLKGLGTLYLANELFVSVKSEDRDEFYKWLRDNGNEALVKDWVFPQTLKAFCKEQLEKGKQLPPTVKATFMSVARTRKST